MKMEAGLEDFKYDFDEMDTQAREVEMSQPGTPEKSGILTAVCYSEAEAYGMYCEYAHNLGFSVRKEHLSYWPNSRNIRTKDFVCSKAGFKRGADLNPNAKYRRSNTRTGCPAMIRFSVDANGVWKVGKCIESHNHELERVTDQHLLRSSRYINDDNGCTLKSMTDAGIKTNHVFHFMDDGVGGVENLGFCMKDPYNFVNKQKRSRIEKDDTNSLVELFKERLVHDCMFAWDMQLDDEGRLMNFYWVDGLGRIDYDCFGDVIIFDTTYRLNKYNSVCAPFVGVNNHWQNVMLGVAFLAEETIESFTWLFRAFLKIMGDKHPITIFTDQDEAMARAIEIALPKTHHRLCQWHIQRNAPSKVWCFNTNQKVRDLFYKCLTRCDSEEEFEQCWAEMIVQGDLKTHDWLRDLYRIRRKWSTVFGKNYFDCGILSTQRSESTNNFCHGISKPTSSLTDCFLGIEKVIMRWRRSEQEEDFKCSQSEVVPLIRNNPILKQASKFYSKKLFSYFQDQFLEGVGGMCIEHVSADSSLFTVCSSDKTDYPGSWNVNFNAIDGTIQCSCSKFETMGILCCHCARVMLQLDIVNIPPKYLMLRWSAKARNDFYAASSTLGSDKKTKYSKDIFSTMTFRNRICRFAYLISTRAQGNRDAEQYMLNALSELAENVDIILGGSKIKKDNGKRPPSPKQTIGDPVKRRPKGI